MRRCGFAYHGAARRRRRPLGCRRALTSVFERRAKLLLRRAEMRRGRGGGDPCRTRIHAQRRQSQRQRHGRARAVKPDKRYAEVARAERRAAALAEQIPRHEQIDIGGCHTRFFNRLYHRALLQCTLRLLPSLLAQRAVGYDLVEAPAQRAVPLLAADYCGGGDYTRTAFEFQCILPYSLRHPLTPQLSARYNISRRRLPPPRCRRL